jgi:23S rRNA C2498 (ribose-2'-O)-methylase RlmM
LVALRSHKKINKKIKKIKKKLRSALRSRGANSSGWVAFFLFFFFFFIRYAAVGTGLIFTQKGSAFFLARSRLKKLSRCLRQRSE